MDDGQIYFPTENDLAFIEMCKRINSIENYEMRVRVYFIETGHFPDPDGPPAGRMINGIEYQLNICPRTPRNCEIYALLYFDLFSTELIENKMRGCEYRLGKCNTITEREKLIKKELENIQLAIKNAKGKDNGVARGYDNSVLKYERGIKRNQAGIINIREVSEYIEGMAFYKLEIHLNELEHNIQEEKISPENKKEKNLLIPNDANAHELTPDNEYSKGKNIKQKIETRPIFKSDAIQAIVTSLKPYFSPEDQDQLRKILKTSSNADQPIIFLDNGNRLADTFKQLFDAEIITGCRKKELEQWVIHNFRYLYKNQITDFQPKYLNNIISSNKNTCKKPIISVVKGFIRTID